MPTLVDHIIKDIAEQTTEFNLEAAKTKNKSAARRARKLSLSIDKLNKQFRALSIK